MVWYEEEVQGLERRVAAGEIALGANGFYGSSSFRLWGTLAVDLSPHSVANVAFGGSTLEACVHFFERLILPIAPRSLTLYAGDNDIGDGRGVDRICASLGAFLAKMDAHLPTTPFAFVSIKPSPAREHLDWQIREVNRYAKERVAARHDSRFVDVYTPMLDARGRPNPLLYDADGLHLCEAGYALWREILLESTQGHLL